VHVAGRLDGIWRGKGWLRHFLFVSGGANGRIADCTSSAHVHIEDASSPLVEHNEFAGALVVHSIGSRPLVRENRVLVGTRTRWCMGITCSAAPTVENNEFAWADGSAVNLYRAGGALVRDNVIRASRTGITVVHGGSVPATIDGNDIGARTAAILVGGSEPIVTGNLLRGEGASALVLAPGGRPVLERNTIAPAPAGQRPLTVSVA
jgi:hypothetical protein